LCGTQIVIKKGQTQCQRLPHEWGLGKGITEAKSYIILGENMWFKVVSLKYFTFLICPFFLEKQEWLFSSFDAAKFYELAIFIFSYVFGFL
jgi:hypothetical protein